MTFMHVAAPYACDARGIVCDIRRQASHELPVGWKGRRTDIHVVIKTYSPMPPDVHTTYQHDSPSISCLSLSLAMDMTPSLRPQGMEGEAEVSHPCVSGSQRNKKKSLSECID
mmetsp:Transcript_8514/g.21012  ORF Transcript_8514/g.21012 Transcript_8514/m.21012 type:complete len:113 (-) Transcript_8514:825-1163(-)